jgi:hypothetical protein
MTSRPFRLLEDSWLLLRPKVSPATQKQTYEVDELMMLVV